MEIIKNKLPDDVLLYLHNLKYYLDLPIYYHGSCQRLDYYNGSDIDMCIFTDNEISTIKKITHYLNISNHKVHKIILYSNNNIISGYKINYYKISIPLEIIIYNIKDKKYILSHYIDNIQIPTYISILLLFIKYFYYKFKLLNYNIYNNIKKTLIC